MKIVSNLKTGVMNAAPIAVGVLGANMIVKKLTTAEVGKTATFKTDSNIPSLILLVGGAFLAGKKGMIGGLGTGLMVGGVVKLAGSFVPGIAAIAAGDDYDGGVYDEIAANVLNGTQVEDPINGRRGSVLNGINGNYTEEVYS